MIYVNVWHTQIPSLANIHTYVLVLVCQQVITKYYFKIHQRCNYLTYLY